MINNLLHDILRLLGDIEYRYRLYQAVISRNLTKLKLAQQNKENIKIDYIMKDIIKAHENYLEEVEKDAKKIGDINKMAKKIKVLKGGD